VVVVSPATVSTDQLANQTSMLFVMLKRKNSSKNNLESVEIIVDISPTTVAFFRMTWLTSVRCRSLFFENRSAETEFLVFEF